MISVQRAIAPDPGSSRPAPRVVQAGGGGGRREARGEGCSPRPSSTFSSARARMEARALRIRRDERPQRDDGCLARLAEAGARELAPHHLLERRRPSREPFGSTFGDLLRGGIGPQRAEVEAHGAADATEARARIRGVAERARAGDVVLRGQDSLLRALEERGGRAPVAADDRPEPEDHERGERDGGDEKRDLPVHVCERTLTDLGPTSSRNTRLRGHVMVRVSCKETADPAASSR